jgi:hypothetical protein
LALERRRGRHVGMDSERKAPPGLQEPELERHGRHLCTGSGRWQAGCHQPEQAPERCPDGRHQLVPVLES